MGAKLSDWTAAHPRGSGSAGSGCSGGLGCFGRQVMDGGQFSFQFTELSTTGRPDRRVDGYRQAIGDNSSLSDARTAVLKLLPRDTQQTAFFVVHGSGASCGLWNLKSRTLGRWFGGKRVGDPQGAIGVDLETPTMDGTAFRRGDVSEAIVGIAPLSKANAC
jgi:hypothetical protein